MPTPVQRSSDRVPFPAVYVFFGLAFSLAWGIFALLIAFPDQIAALTGPLSAKNPLFILAVYAPAIAALSQVLWFGGVSGLGRFLSRLLLVRCSIGWYGFLLFGIPAIYFAGAAIKGTLVQFTFPFESPIEMLAAMGFMLILGPVEEFGWRGVALPLLQRRVTPLVAGLIVGIAWGLWHLPAFYLSGTPQSAWSFTPFLIGSVAVSVILTPLFNRAGGSILLAALYHFQLNNPLFPDAQPYDMGLFALVAVAVVWLNRATMLRPGGAIDVIPSPRP